MEEESIFLDPAVDARIARLPGRHNLESALPRSIVPSRTLEGCLAALMIADGDGFETRPVERAELDLEGFLVEGLRGERHRGAVRRADARVPWFPRGTPIRNSRQVSIVSREDLAAIAAGLGLAGIEPAWLGANLVIEGVPDLSMLPRGTRIFCPDRLTLVVEEQNVPCRGPGKMIASHHPGREGLDLAFVNVARRLRGLVGWVERPGSLRVGDVLSFRLPEQWVY